MSLGTPAADPACLRVMLADDHAVVREGYRRLLASEPGLRVVAEVGDADSAFHRLQAESGGIDVLVLDLSMPGRSGLDLLRRASLRWPALRVLVFSMHDSTAMVVQALKAGAAGFITKSSAPELLVQAVRDVARGQQVLSPDVAHAGQAQDAQAAPPHLRLSGREFDIFRLLALGLTVEDIAARLHLSSKTVSNHQTLIRQKLGVATAVELLRYAQAHGLASG